MVLKLLDLPIEVLSMICAEFAPPDYSIRFKPGATLWSISLTCSTLRDIAVPFLFGPVACQQKEEPCLLRLLVQRPYIARSIRKMWFDGDRGRRPRILSSRLNDTKFIDEHIQNDSLWSGSKGLESGTLRQMSDAEYMAYALTMLPRLETLYMTSPLIGDMLHGRQDIFFPSLKTIGGHDSPAADLMSLAYIVNHAPRLTDVTAFLNHQDVEGASLKVQSTSVTHLDLRDACAQHDQLDDIVRGLPNLEKFSYQQCSCCRAHISPQGLCQLLAARADSLKELSVDLEKNVVDESNAPPANSLKIGFKQIHGLKKLKLRAANTLYGSEKRQPQPGYHIDFAELLPPQIEEFTADFDCGLFRDDFMQLARIAPYSFPNLKRVAVGGAFNGEEDCDLIGAFLAAGIKVY